MGEFTRVNSVNGMQADIFVIYACWQRATTSCIEPDANVTIARHTCSILQGFGEPCYYKIH